MRRGWIEVGQTDAPVGFIRALDEGGQVWNGKDRYRSLNEAFRALEAGVRDWMQAEGIHPTATPLSDLSIADKAEQRIGLLLDGSLKVSIQYNRTASRCKDDIRLTFVKTCPPEQRGFGADQVSICVTPEQAEQVAAALLEAVRQSRSARKRPRDRRNQC